MSSVLSIRRVDMGEAGWACQGTGCRDTRGCKAQSLHGRFYVERKSKGGTVLALRV